MAKTGKPKSESDGKGRDEAGANVPDPPRDEDGKIEYTTFRLYADDGAELADLAGMSGNDSIADVYRKYCAPIVRQKIIERARKKIQDLEKRAE